MGFCGPSGPDGECLVIICAVVSAQLAQGRSLEEIELLGAFFEALGSNLALIAARRAGAALPEQTSADPAGSCCSREENRVKWEDNNTGSGNET